MPPTELRPWTNQFPFPLHQECFVPLFIFFLIFYGCPLIYLDHIYQILIFSDVLPSVKLQLPKQTFSTSLERNPRNGFQSTNYTHGTTYYYATQLLFLASDIYSPIRVFIHSFIHSFNIEPL